MVILLIRRFVRIEKEKEFVEKYRSQAPGKNPDFIHETLTRINSDTTVPENLKSLSLGGPECVTYLNVATWASWEAFAGTFDLSDVFDPEIETAPRQRTVLDVILDARSN